MMNILKEKKSNISQGTIGKILSVSDAMQLTDDFTKMLKGKAFVSFNSQKMAELVSASKCRFVSFRYYATGQSVGLIFGPVYPDSASNPKWICSEGSQYIGREEYWELTDENEFNNQGIKSHIYSASLLQEVLELCVMETKVYFGEYDNIPALVITPANIAGYSHGDKVCLDHGALCPPDCYGIFE